MTKKEQFYNDAYIAELQGNVEKLKGQGFHVDGWMNFFAGIGGSADKTEQTYFGEFNVLVDDELTRMWLGEGLGKKIVSSVSDDMTRNWYSVQGDADNTILKELTRLNAETEVNNALKWARLYRGALIVVGANDGNKLDQPLNMNGIKSIDWLKVYSAPKVEISTTDIVTEPTSPYFEDVEIFRVRKRNGDEFKVHRSRCLIFKGDPLPDTYTTLTTDNEYWGVSILQSVYRNLKDFGSTYQSLANLMMELVIGKYKFSNLAKLLSENNTAAIYTRMQIINASKSMINGVMIGEGEEYTRDAANVAGIAELIDRFMMLMSAVTEIPVTVLFGRSPAGENATGEADLTRYYDMIKSKQKTWLAPPMMRLVSLVNVYTKAVKEEDLMIEWNAVWGPSEKELIEMRKKQAETDHIYIMDAVLSPEVVYEARFVGGYSFDTPVPDTFTEKEVEPPEEPVEEEPEE